MTVYTYLGSIPSQLPEGVTEEDYLANGWKPAPEQPDCPEGKEVVWLNWEWVIRDPKPQDDEGFQWNWDHGKMNWVNLPYVQNSAPSLESTQITALLTTQIVGLTSTQLGALS